MFILLKKFLLACGLMSTIATVQAAESADVFVKNMSDSVVKALNTNPSLKNGNVSLLSTYVDSQIMPHVDFRSMISRVVGPIWNQTSAAEQNELIAESRKYLVRTYAGSLKGTMVKSIDVYPAKGSEVRTRINTQSGKQIAVSYRLVNNGAWKISDVSVAGVWMVNSFAGQFRPVVAKSGVSGLIAQLKSR